MARIRSMGAWTLCLAVSLSAQDSTLTCEVVDDGVEQIKCTFATPRKNETREISFYWHSDMHPQDDRERDIVLPANHGSVYDYRYLRGRAQGAWTVTVTLTDTDGREHEVVHAFMLEDDHIVSEAR